MWIYKDNKPRLNNKNIDRKYLKNMRNNQFLKVKNSHIEVEKDFMELKNRELKDRVEKIKIYRRTIL